jgi:hypothetical protein
MGNPLALIRVIPGEHAKNGKPHLVAAVAASLRGSGGHLKTEANSLPVVNGQFLAGDVRAAENPR